MSRLITTSLLGSISWARNCPPSWREKAFKDLRNQLARVWVEPEKGSAIERGIRFEKTVYALLNRGVDIESVNASDAFKEVLRKCENGEFQKRTKRFLTVAGEEYCIYGKIDVWKPTESKIIDIKTTSRFKGRDHYLGSMQHVIYCHNERVPDFTYLVVEFDGDGSNTIVDLHEIEYHNDNYDAMKAEIEDRIVDTMEFLQSDEELLKLYLTKFSRY